ncbi:hypothetical protein C2G38_2157967 [Gigaspora rosea]|uniref:Uncharacterized protein n=1 Tax=Gigaspora rosea TaxID=44941 RepID=A0A397W319_9GLOM|nr:hypothetical protein C2G38_2157967 [Gigaspora rosea]
MTRPNTEISAKLQSKKAAQKSVESRRKPAINKHYLPKMNQQQLDSAYKTIERSFNNESLSKNDKKRNELISLVHELSPKEVHSANHMITIMRYPKGAQKGKKLFPYLQNKAFQFTHESLYKSTTLKLLERDNRKLQHKIQKLKNQNMQLIHKHNQWDQQYDTYKIKAYESKRGEIKNFILSFMFWSFTHNEPLVTMTHLRDIDKCDGKSVSETVQIIMKNSQIDPNKCFAWLSDNTAYMSGNNNAAFGKLPSTIGFMKVMHPYYLAYLAWELHVGYNIKAVELLDEEQIKEIFNNLENGIHKAFDHFTKWLILCNTGVKPSASTKDA